MTFLAAPIAILGFKTTVGSLIMTAFTGLQAIGQIVSSNAAARADERNAAETRRIASLNAQALEEEGRARRSAAEEEAEIAERKRRRLLSEQRAELAGRGILLSEGAPLDLLEESFFELTRDIQNIRQQGIVSQREALNRATIQREEGALQASNLLAKASATRRTGLLSAGSTILGGVVQASKSFTPAGGGFTSAIGTGTFP